MLNKLGVFLLPLFFLTSLPFAAQLAAQEVAPPTLPSTLPSTLNSNYVDRAILTTAVENREPVDDVGTRFTLSGADYDRLVFFTHMVNHDGRGIQHRWYYNDQLQADINLAIGSNSWRTYSTKQISFMESGEWTIRVVNDRDEELIVYHFTVER